MLLTNQGLMSDRRLVTVIAIAGYVHTPSVSCAANGDPNQSPVNGGVQFAHLSDFLRGRSRPALAAASLAD